MHAVSFKLKRAHLKAVAFAREAVAKVPGMTPARFDALYAIRRAQIVVSEGDPAMGRGLGMDQSEMTRKLGLARSTVSKLLRRLEQLGWVKRGRCPDDRRRNHVTLTAEGLRRIWRAMRRVFRGRILLREYEKMFAPTFGSRLHVLTRISDAHDLVEHIAHSFGDRAYLEYEFGVEPDH